MLPDLPPASADVSGAWPRLERFLAAHLPALLADLAPGASEADLDALAKKTGLDLPASTRAFYRAHDGQRGAASGLFLGMEFLSTSAAGEEWGRWTSLLKDDPTLAQEIVVTAQPEGAVQAVYAVPGWIPIASDGAGNHLAVDLAPGPKGTAGQVISFGTDEATRYVLAPSPLHLIAWCADALEAGTAIVAPEPDAPGGQRLRLRDTDHFLDALPGLIGTP